VHSTWYGRWQRIEYVIFGSSFVTIHLTKSYSIMNIRDIWKNGPKFSVHHEIWSKNTSRIYCVCSYISSYWI